MKKTVLAALGVAMLLSSCDTTAPLISIPAENVDQLPLKISELNESQEKKLACKRHYCRYYSRDECRKNV